MKGRAKGEATRVLLKLYKGVITKRIRGRERFLNAQVCTIREREKKKG